MDADQSLEEYIVHSCRAPIATRGVHDVAVSVIVPVLNDAQALEALLSDLETPEDWEVVVVDGGSTDASDASGAVAASADVWITSAPGRARQLQAGVVASHGDLVWMLHADSEITPELIREVRAATSDPEVVWGRSNVRLDDPRPIYRVIEAAMNCRSRLTGICTGDQGVFVRRRVLDLIGGVPQLPLMEDIELSKRLRRLSGLTCLKGPIGTSARRWQRDGVMRTVLSMWGYRLRYFLGADPAVLAREYYPASPASPQGSDDDRSP